MPPSAPRHDDDNNHNHREPPQALALSTPNPAFLPIDFGTDSFTYPMNVSNSTLDLGFTSPAFGSVPDMGPPCTCHLRRPQLQRLSPLGRSPLVPFSQPSTSIGTTQALDQISITPPTSNEYTRTSGLGEGQIPGPILSGLHSSAPEPQSINHHWALHVPAPPTFTPTPSPAEPTRSCMCMPPAGATSSRPVDGSTFHTQHAIDYDGHFPPHSTSFPSIARSVSCCTKDSHCLQNLPPSPQDDEFPCLSALHDHSQAAPVQNSVQKRLRGAVSGESLDDQLAGVKRVRAPDGTAKEVCAISRVPYVRHQQPKKLCPYCKEHPGGFRGEHELRRHIDRAHAVEGKRKMWVCVDASPDGRLLSNCKKCRGNKKYGAYYNAAAHLRRTHFNPRPRGSRARHGDEDLRGGRGVGDDPPMDELKRKWIKEVEVDVSNDEDERDESSPEAASPPQDEPKTPNSAVPAANFFAGRMDGYGLSLAPSSPIGVCNQDYANSCASNSSSDDSQIDALFFGCPLDLGDLPFDANMAPETFAFQ